MVESVAKVRILPEAGHDLRADVPAGHRAVYRRTDGATEGKARLSGREGVSMDFTDRLEALLREATKGDWRACQNGECTCMRLSGKDHPIAKFDSGSWGDSYPAIRLVGDSSFDMKAEAYIEKMPYGDIPAEQAKANLLLTELLHNAAPALLAVVKAAQKTLKHHGSAQRAVEQSGLRQALTRLSERRGE